MRTQILIVVIIAAVFVTACHNQATVLPIASKPAPSPTESTTDLLDINSASKAELEALPGIGEAYAQKIIDNRPYREKTDLVRLKIIPETTYKAIANKIIARHKQ
ncbi:MAG TPA: helix-hairpin-helix domain-containing protein [Pyrinomonadaceae bacterium]